MEPIRRDPALGPLVEAHGELAVGTAEDAFRRLVVAIVNQQLSVSSAAAIRERLFDAVEITPDGIRAAETSTLRDAGLSASKAEYVCNAARAFRQRDLTPAGLSDASDEEAIASLTEIRGVGTWTAKMYLIGLNGYKLLKYCTSSVRIQPGPRATRRSESTRC
jgi:DNA-3-methyladenine glycosylase II